MYKAQIKFQKIICLFCLITGALVFIYSLGLVTDLYDSLFSTMMDPEDLTDTWVEGSIIYYDIQGFNKSLTHVGIGLILISLLLFFTCTNSRRKYYIGNYVAIAAYSAAGIASGMWAIPQLQAFKTQFLTTVDFEALKEFSEMWGTLYTESTFWFDAGFVVFGIVFLGVALLICNLIWKIIVMNKERSLIKAGKEAA